MYTTASAIYDKIGNLIDVAYKQQTIRRIFMGKRQEKKAKMLKEKSEREVISALAEFVRVREVITRNANAMDASIDEAALEGRDNYSDYLIEIKAGLISYSREIQYLEMQMRNNAMLASTLGSLESLPKAIASCKAMLGIMPNLKKVGGSLDDLKTTIAESRKALAEMLKNFSGQAHTEETKVFSSGKLSAEEVKIVNDEKEARNARIARKAAEKTGVAPASQSSAASVKKEIDNIDEIIKRMKDINGGDDKD